MVFNIFGNSTHSISWVPSPTTRGTADILQICLVTTSLCVWTALHLNIKEHDDPTFLKITYQTWRKVGWLMIGLFAPELLVYTAWYQRAEAKSFVKLYNNYFGLVQPPRNFDKGGKYHKSLQRFFSRGCEEDVESAGETGGEKQSSHQLGSSFLESKRRPWTLTQGFFAQMGGFVLLAPGEYPYILPAHQMTLTRKSFEFVLLTDYGPPNPSKHDRRELKTEDKGQLFSRYQSTDTSLCLVTSPFKCKFEAMLDVPERVVNQRSKANGMAKTLVCLQATWFCLQCVNRAVHDLSITLLELNTFAHCICAFLVYMLWWQKPLDIEESEVLPISGVSGIHIWACINRGKKFRDLCRASGLLDFLWRRIRHFRDWVYGVYPKYFHIEGDLICARETQSHTTSQISNISCNLVFLDRETVRGYLIHTGEYSQRHHSEILEKNGVWWPHNDQSVPGQDRQLLATEYVDRGEITQKSVTLHTEPSEAVNNNAENRALNWPCFDIKRPSVQFVFLFVTLLYGAAHGMAWKTVFPSYLQQTLWRVSSVMIIAARLPTIAIYFSLELAEFEYEPGRRQPDRRYFYHVPRWRCVLYRLSRPFWDRRLACLSGVDVDGFPRLDGLGATSNDIWPRGKRLYKSVDNLLKGVLALVLVGYVCARIYLVVECFIQLFHLEPGPVFAEPAWLGYFPHAG